MKETRLQKDLSAALLSTRRNGKAVWDTLQEARQELEFAVAAANEVLAKNPLTPLVARQVSGMDDAMVRVDSSGNVLLCSPTSGRTRTYHSSLPDIRALRDRALALGLDPAPFGRRKRELVAAIHEAENRTCNKRVVVAPALAPVSVLKPEAD